MIAFLISRTVVVTASRLAGQPIVPGARLIARLLECHDGKGSTLFIADFDVVAGNIPSLVGRPAHEFLSNQQGFRASIV